MSQPHIVLVTFDDMGWNDIGYQSTDLPKATPTLDALASKGLKLTRYYTQPSCTPSRVTIMTGKYAYKNGFQNIEVQPTYGIGVPLSNDLMPHWLRQLGYRTEGFGKWNIGHCNIQYLPHMRGFHHFLGYFCPGHGYSDHRCSMSRIYKDMYEGWNSYSNTGPTPEKHSHFVSGGEYDGTYDTLLYTERSKASIREHPMKFPGTPLFMWLAHHGIHAEEDSDPEPPASLITDANHEFLKVLKLREDLAQDDDKKFYKERYITATVLMSLDNSVNSLVAALEGAGMMDDTIMFFHSDNGGIAQKAFGHPGNNWPSRSQKFTYFDGGVHVPAFVYAPALLPASRQGASFDGLMHHVDLLTTFVALAGGDAKEQDGDLDGFDLWPALSTPGVASPREEVVLNLPRNSNWHLGTNETDQGIAIISGRFKLLINHFRDGAYKPEPFNGTVPTCYYTDYSHDKETGGCVFENFLFDLENDPTEQTNLVNSTAHKPVKEAMLSRALDLVATQGNYGKILPEFDGSQSLRENDTYIRDNYFFSDYVSPWECEIME